MSKFCPNCGHENKDVATFCGNCGSKLVSPDLSSNLRDNGYSTNGSTTTNTTTTNAN
ncbi:MAG: zinc ribbon domain-containing protein, partial [Methanobrevibacter sp.]|nr:zinc ribbon domain-containing protein [Methanobrevibacter sp.]